MDYEFINAYRDLILKTCGDNLEALILVGSFARGEGIKTLSDVEFLAVVKNLSIAQMPASLDKTLSVGFTTRKHLARLKPFIFTVEIKEFGKVVWGDSKILQHIPQYAYSDIAICDAFTLLNNRIVEQLIIWKKIKSGETIRTYDLTKGTIQMVNSLLAFHKCYCGLYTEKEEAITRLLREQTDIGKHFSSLLKEIHEAFALLTDSARYNHISGEEALKKWLQLKANIKMVWDYEKRILSYPSLKDKIRDYARAITTRGIPRFHIYQKAAHEYFSDAPDAVRCSEIIVEWEKFIK